MRPMKPEQVVWVVNDIAELGVKIGNEFFWFYKGASIVADGYDDVPAGCHEDGTPIMWRRVGKVEFGEVIHPLKFLRGERLPDRYTMELEPSGMPGNESLEDIDRWQPLPTRR